MPYHLATPAWTNYICQASLLIYTQVNALKLGGYYMGILFFEQVGVADFFNFSNQSAYGARTSFKIRAFLFYLPRSSIIAGIALHIPLQIQESRILKNSHVLFR